MKVISARVEKIARVNCSCCGDDEHYVDISFNKRFDEKDPDEYLFEFEFDTADGIHPFMPLKHRLRNIINMLKNEDNFRHEEYCDAILLDPEQLLEIYDVVREYADKVLNEKEKDMINNPDRPEFIKKYVKFKKQHKNDWVEVFPFRGEDGLTYYIDHFEDEKEPNKVLLHDFGIGWFYPKNTHPEDIRRYCRWYLFKNSKTGFRHMTCSLTKTEAIKFLASLNYIFTNVEKKEDELSCIMI